MIRLFLYFLLIANNVNSYSLFFPRLFLQKKSLAIYDNILSSEYYTADYNITSIYNNDTERIQKFIEYIKLKKFDSNEIEIWDSGEIEWEF